MCICTYNSFKTAIPFLLPRISLLNAVLVLFVVFLSHMECINYCFKVTRNNSLWGHAIIFVHRTLFHFSLFSVLGEGFILFGLILVFSYVKCLHGSKADFWNKVHWLINLWFIVLLFLFFKNISKYIYIHSYLPPFSYVRDSILYAVLHLAFLS